MLQQQMHASGQKQQQAAVIGFASGAIGCLAPISDPDMHTLIRLQKPLALACPGPLGLNAHAFGCAHPFASRLSSNAVLGFGCVAAKCQASG